MLLVLHNVGDVFPAIFSLHMVLIAHLTAEGLEHLIIRLGLRDGCLSELGYSLRVDFVNPCIIDDGVRVSGRQRASFDERW